MIVDDLKVVFVGASGMVGAAVLQECLENPAVSSILCVGRGSCGRQHPKLTELIHPDLFDLKPAAERLKGYNACFYTAGVTSAGMNEADYTKIIYGMTKAVVEVLLPLNPDMAMVFVSGARSDSTEKGGLMWARVKGRAENLLLGMPFRSVTIIRLAGLVAAEGFRSKTFLYKIFYAALGPIMPLLARLFPNAVTTPQILGRAFIRSAQGRAPKKILEPADIHALGSATP
jgi:nucleoside-diphosphate-sugar epimerase